MKKYIFPILMALSALSLAAAAAFFSVSGLSKLFGGAQTEVIIMASALEFAKLVTASFLHRYWKLIKIQMKVYLTIGVITVMLITSAGIYGFLSNAYATTSGKLQNIDAQVEMVEQKKIIINSEVARLQENKDLKSERIKSLINLRITQESRLDSLYKKSQTSSAKRVEQQIEQANSNIESINIEIDTLNNQIQRKSANITVLDLEVLNLKNNDTNGEVGSLKYISTLTGKSMDSVVNFFIFLLIFVFDPLAVSLVIATNIVIKNELGKKEEIKPEVESDKNISKEDDLKAFTESNQKTDEVIRYVADENGEFKAQEPKIEQPLINDESKDVAKKIIMEQIKAQGIEHNANYLNFLEVLFKGGVVKSGDLLPPYGKFLEDIKSAGLVYTDKEVKDFLTICNLFKITDMSGPEKKISKDYLISKDIISLLSK